MHNRIAGWESGVDPENSMWGCTTWGEGVYDEHVALWPREGEGAEGGTMWNMKTNLLSSMKHEGGQCFL